MDFDQWEPIYEEILRDFRWIRERDEEAARSLSELLKGKETDLRYLREKIEGKNVLVCGKASTLSSDLEMMDIKKYLIIAADGATSALLEMGIVPDIIVTDL